MVQAKKEVIPDPFLPHHYPDSLALSQEIGGVFVFFRPIPSSSKKYFIFLQPQPNFNNELNNIGTLMKNTKRRVSCPQLTKLTLILTLLLGWGSQAWGDAKELPYEYGFEGITSSNSGLSSEGWTLVDCYNSSYSTSYSGTSPYVLSSGGYAGSNAFRFYPNSSYSAQCLISPELTTSLSEIEVTFYYRSSSNSNPTQTFCVGYSTTNTSSFTWGDEISYKSTTWETYNNIFPAGTKYIAVKYTNTTSYAYLYLDDFNISYNNPYKTPTSFALDSYNATSATFSWTAGNSETKWQFDYSTNPDFTPGTGINGTSVSITDNPYTLSGLTTGTTYYASIRADYGSSNYSEWTEKVSFTPRAEVETTINDANTTTNGYIPFYASAANTSTSSQFIIPSSQLSDVSGRQITKLVFYCSAETKSFGAAQWEVYLKETDNTTYSSYAFEPWGTKVFNSAKLSVSDYMMEITLNTPFNYSGKNLMIGFKQTVSGTSNYSSFVCVSTSDQVGYNLSNTSNSYLKCYPKVTITSVPITADPVQMGENGFTTYASIRKLDLTEANLPSGLKAYKAESVSGNIVRFTEIDQTVSANTGILLKGIANTTYNILVAESGTAPEGNLLMVNTTGSTFDAADGYTYFGMKKATSSSDQLLFATFAPGTVAIPANKAYLKVLTSSLPAEGRALTCIFDDEETTAIKNVERETLNLESCFDLQGRRVAQPTKGLYIVNGKKYVVK